MNKLLIILSSLLLLMTGCVSKNSTGSNSSNPSSNDNGANNPKMVGKVSQINYIDGVVNSILIFDEENMAFVFRIDDKVDFKEKDKLKTGDKVEIEHAGEIRESYPAQGTALKVNILNSKSDETVNVNPFTYTVIPIKADYKEDYYQKSLSNVFGITTDIIDDKSEFDKYMKDLNFVPDFKINITGKYDQVFFKNHKLIYISKFTSSTPTYEIKEFKKNGDAITAVMEEKTSEVQTDDIVIKGFLIEVESSLINENTVIEIEYLRRVSTK
ncbi:DUF3221 domain-containing protein [Clostridium thermarum]|uniref:DUF3221 domain-containing protein n=1 Tax=Clostridium thermarum TaxID=1716543 RepID=UPI0013D2F24E|nr:DUF3221 domain-containing protein [Clostridium thermarum]